MGERWRAGRVVAVLWALCACWIPAAAQAPLDVQTIVVRVGQRVAEYYRRAQNLICTETSVVFPIRTDWSPDGMPRTVQSELHLELAAAHGGSEPSATVVREIRLINGRVPRERDKKNANGCMDPQPLSPAPLDFLLPAHRGDYRFTSVRAGNKDGRAAIGVDFKSRDPKSKAELNEDPRGLDGCFDTSGPIAAAGRVWVDAHTFDVLRVEQHIEGPVGIRVPVKVQRRDGLPDWVTLDRDDLTVDYKVVAFTDPGEALLVQTSIDEMELWRGGLQSVRRSDTYSDYRRFLTDARIVRDER
ncbi:MAG: hypothetical protein ACRD1V_17365 [Vicinamibacterales bacterium]